MYLANSIVAIKGFSYTHNINSVQPIWSTFQYTKNVYVQHRHLQPGMVQWAQTQGVELDHGIFFEQKMNDNNIINLCFKPGQGVAQFCSEEQGLSLLFCYTCTLDKIERVCKCKVVEQ